MGREIRRVPPNWEHPKRRYYNNRGEIKEGYKGLHDEDYESHINSWFEKLAKWQSEGKSIVEFIRYEGRMLEEETFRPAWKEDEATWYQVYETVSDGTPVTPPFATKGELVDYLVKYGDFWDQKRGDGGWNRASAEKFVNQGHTFSLVVDSVGIIREPRDT